MKTVRDTLETLFKNALNSLKALIKKDALLRADHVVALARGLEDAAGVALGFVPHAGVGAGEFRGAFVSSR